MPEPTVNNRAQTLARLSELHFAQRVGCPPAPRGFRRRHGWPVIQFTFFPLRYEIDEQVV
jgi:hypothetical protein